MSTLQTFSAFALLAALAAPARPQDRAAPAPASPSAGQPTTPDPIPTEPWHPDDKRRTLRTYGHNLLGNFAHVFSGENLHSLVVTAALAAPAFASDDEVVDYFARHPHPTYGRMGARLGGGLAAAGLTIGFFSAGRYAHNSRFRAATYDASQAVIVNQAYTQAIKFTVRRERPDESNRQSFPSGHSSNAFTVAAVAAHHYPRLAVPAYAVASWIAVSRLAAARHHFSDIVAGAGFGFGVGKVVVHRNGRPPDEAPAPPALSVGFDSGPAGDGRGVVLRLAF